MLIQSPPEPSSPTCVLEDEPVFGRFLNDQADQSHRRWKLVLKAGEKLDAERFSRGAVEVIVQKGCRQRLDEAIPDDAIEFISRQDDSGMRIDRSGNGDLHLIVVAVQAEACSEDPFILFV